MVKETSFRGMPATAYRSMVMGLTAGSERLQLFAGLMLLGDLVKLWFIRAHNFTVRDFAPRILIALTLFYVVGYALLILLEWMR